MRAFWEDSSEVVLKRSALFSFVPFSKLPGLTQDALTELVYEGSLVGLLVPAPKTGLPVKAIEAGVAAELASMGSARAYPMKEISETLLELLATGAVEMLIDSRTWSGGAALRHLGHIRASKPDSNGNIQKISLAAIEHSAQVPLNDIARLSARLYFYNRSPITGDNRQVSIQRHTFSILKEWKRAARLEYEQKTQALKEGWHLFCLRRAPEKSRTNTHFKLYVSPALDHLPEVLSTTLRIVSEMHVQAFKIGANLEGLLRPDKLILYFSTFEELKRIAARLEDEIDGAKEHGVPFSATIDASGILSWGQDPPSNWQPLSWTDKQSWRVWITNRIASSLLLSRATAPTMVSHLSAALDYLWYCGVDPQSWSPRSTLFEGSC